MEGGKVTRQIYEFRIRRNGEAAKIHLLVIASVLEFGESSYAVLILEDVTEIVELRKILQICMICKKIRIDQDFWESVEHYLYKYKNIELSHGICPNCYNKKFPDT
jgi:hypothetical protein